MDQQRTIRIDEDGTATYERVAVIPAVNGTLERRRVLEAKRVDALSLVPARGSFALGPPGTRTVCSDEDRTVIVIEDPPMVRTIRWVTKHERYRGMKDALLRSGAHLLFNKTVEEFRHRLDTQEVFQLAFPYVVRCYLFNGDCFVRATCWYGVRPLYDERSELFVPNMPNNGDHYGHNDHICLTEIGRHVHTGSIALDIVEMEREFWGGIWNDHWTENFFQAAARIPEVSSPWAWEQTSLRDGPEAVRVLPWQSSERTIGQEVRRLLNIRTQTDRAHAFAFFQQRVQAADQWDAVSPDADVAARVSPAQTIVLAGKTTLRVGDKLIMLTKAFAPCVPDQQYAIEWFGCQDRKASRTVKLVGIDEPLPLIINGQLGDRVILVRAPIEPVALNGTMVEPGACILFKDAAAWPFWNADTCYEITNVWRDPRGFVLADMRDHDFPVVIGEGDTLAAGLQLFPKEERDADGYLLRDSFTLADGTVCRYGDRCIIQQSSETAIDQAIGRFVPLSHGSTMWVCVAGEGRRFGLADFDGNLCDGVVLLPAEPITAVRVGDVTVRVGDSVKSKYCSVHTITTIRALSPQFRNGARFAQISCVDAWIHLATSDEFSDRVRVLPRVELTPRGVRAGTFHSVGSWFFDRTLAARKAVRFVRCNDRDVDVQFADRNEFVPFIRESELVPQLTPVSVRHLLPSGTVLRRGMRMRLRVAASGLQAGTILRISHIVRDADKPPLVVTYEGWGISADDLAYFALVARGDGIPFKDSPTTYGPGKELSVGVRVRYLGGDKGLNCNFREDEAKMVSAAIVGSVDSRGYLCKFDRAFPGLHNGDLYQEALYQWIHGVCLQRLEEPTLQRVFQPRADDREIIEQRKEVA